MPPTRALSPAAMAAPIRCPRCGTPFTAEITSIVDASDPVAREALLGGRLNRTACPACGAPAQVATPLLYFDLAGEVALVLVPEALGLPHAEQERRIGQLTNQVLQALPPEERRMYLVQPRTFVSEQSFLEAVLEANGVSTDDVRRMRRAAGLVDTLADCADEAAIRAELAAAGRAPDAELAAMADALAHEAAERGEADRADRLLALRDALVAMGAPVAPRLDDLLPRLQEARAGGALPDVAAELRPILDYAFFSALTARIEAARESDEREALAGLRADLLAAVEGVDAQIQAQIQRGIDSIQAILAAPDASAAVRVRAPALDSAFFAALEQAHAEASRQGHGDAARRLAEVRRLALEVFEASLPARDQLANRLARLTAAADRAAALDAADGLLDESLVRHLRRAAFELKAAGGADAARNLRAAADEIAQRLAGQAGDTA